MIVSSFFKKYSHFQNRLYFYYKFLVRTKIYEILVLGKQKNFFKFISVSYLKINRLKFYLNSDTWWKFEVALIQKIQADSKSFLNSSFS